MATTATRTNRAESTDRVRTRARRRAVFTTGEVATICKVAPRTVGKWVDGGRIPGAYRIPGSQDRRIPRAALLRFLKDHGMPTRDLQPTTNVLLVGCGAALAGRVRELLPAAGEYRVESVSTGFEVGVAMTDFPPDALVLDLSVGRAEACGIAARVRQMAGDGDRPLLVALTGEDDAEPGTLLGNGFFDEVRKSPVDPAELADLIRTTAGGD